MASTEEMLNTFDFGPILLEEGGLIAGAVLIVKTIDEEGNPSIQLLEDGIGLLERVGLLEVTLTIEKNRLVNGCEGH